MHAIGVRSGVFAVVGALVLATALIASVTPPVRANPTQYGHFKAKYPSSPLAQFPNPIPPQGPNTACLVCHPTTAGPAGPPPNFFNPFGASYRAGAAPTSRDEAFARFDSIATANADDDSPSFTVTSAGTGSGTVSSAPGPSGTVTLTASPAAGSTFTGWSGGGTPGCGGTGTCTLLSDNINEINSGTFPGDGASVPTINVTATFTAAGSTGPAVGLGLNGNVFSAGNVVTLTMSTQSGNPPVAADFYLILVIPGGFAYIFDGAQFALIFDGANVLAGAVKPFRAGTAVANGNETILEASVPTGLPPGTYSFMIVLARAGTDALNIANWLAGPSTAAFNIN
jgi:hypothetical protein